MSLRSDFAKEESDLQYLAQELSTANFHLSSVASEGTKYDWGFPKKITRRAPLKSRREFRGFVSVLKNVPTDNDNPKRRSPRTTSAYFKKLSDVQEEITGTYIEGGKKPS